MDRAAKDKALLDRIGIDQIARNARARRRGQLGLALVFMSPALILVVGVLLVPVLFNIWLSFTKWK
jgi:ABC-type sugar transport system permease subunit